jgi:histone-lysine N-methyltransferase SETMAR
MEVLKRLIHALRRKRGELWRDRLLILHHDNASAHSTLRVSQFLAGKAISAMDHPSYSPDLSPADFWLFPELESLLKRKRFSDVEDIKSSGKKC